MFPALSADGTLTATFAQDTPKMHVSSITISVHRGGNNNNQERGEAVVTIVDSTGNPVSGATVTGTWTGSGAQSDNGATASNGQIMIHSNYVDSYWNDHTFTVTISDVVKTGMTYDSSANVVTTKTITG